MSGCARIQTKNGPFRGHCRLVSIVMMALLDHDDLAAMATAAMIAAMVAVHLGAGAVPVVNAVMMAAALDDDGMRVGIRRRCRHEDRGERRDQ